jgi:hypothetical protein
MRSRTPRLIVVDELRWSIDGSGGTGCRATEVEIDEHRRIGGSPTVVDCGDVRIVTVRSPWATSRAGGTDSLEIGPTLSPTATDRRGGSACSLRGGTPEKQRSRSGGGRRGLDDPTDGRGPRHDPFDPATRDARRRRRRSFACRAGSSSRRRARRPRPTRRGVVAAGAQSSVVAMATSLSARPAGGCGRRARPCVGATTDL